VDGLVCGPTNLCQAPGPAGSPCNINYQCVDGLVCRRDVRQCGDPVELGETCQRDEECVTNACSIVSWTCTAPGTLGTACAEDVDCLDALICDPGARCSVIGGVGDGCTEDADCEATLMCDLTMGRCAS
jgi:hypothetical protein